MTDVAAAPIPADGPAAEYQEGKVVEEQPGFKIFAGNLAFSIDDDALREFFAPVATRILSCEVIQRGTRSAGYGFVAVSTEDAAKDAIDALNGQDFQGRKVIVELAKPAEEKEKERSERKTKRRSGRRGNKAVPGEVSEAEANGEAEKAAAATDNEDENKLKKKKKKSAARKLRNKAKKDTTAEGDAHAEGDDSAESPAAEGEKRKPRPKRAPRPRRAAGEEPTGEQSKTTLFVANLPFSVDDAGLAELFSKEDFTVTSARVVRWRWGHPRRSKGYGFVVLGDEEQQAKALEQFQGREIPDGKQGVRKIALKIAVDPTHDDSDAEKTEGEKKETEATEASGAGATEVAA